MADPVKVHKEYDELIDLLLSRGMDVPDRDHAIKKISQVGYWIGPYISIHFLSLNP